MSLQTPGALGAVVANFGGYSSKIGFAGDDRPQVWTPSFMGEYEDQNNVEEKGISDGNDKTAPAHKSSHSRQFEMDIQYPKHDLSLISPMEEGLISDWEAMEKFLDYHLDKSLQVDLSERPFLLVEPSLQTRKDREKWAELLFEHYNTPGIFIGKEATMAVYSVARVSGISIDIGHTASTITPVHDGYALMMGVRRNPIAGRVMDNYYKELLDNKGEVIRPYFGVDRSKSNSNVGLVAGSSSSAFGGPRGLAPGVKAVDNAKWHASFINFHIMQTLRDVRQAIFRVAEEAFEEKQIANIPNVPFSLPDGQILQVDADKFRVPELLFDPSPVSEYTPGAVSLNQSILDACIAVDPAARSEVAASLIVHGGSSALPGLDERLMRELADVSALGTVPGIAHPPKPEQLYAAWLGGSIVGSLTGFEDMWVNKEEWKEHGGAIIHRKCP